MPRRSPILETLAELYAASKPGLTGASGRDFSIRFEELLLAAQCASGDASANALQDLLTADGTELTLKKHPRSGDIQLVKVPLACEPALFIRIARPSPTAEREAWAALFTEAATWPVPPDHAESWQTFCNYRAELVRHGQRWQPFRRHQRARARLQLEALAALLAWSRPNTLLRTVSSQITPSSKFLERSRATLQTLLAEGTAGRLLTFADLGIIDTPRTVTFHGPLQITLGGETKDYTGISGSLDEGDLARAGSIHCTAPRCITVENATSFHELRLLETGDLLVSTSYPNRATLELLRRLPATLPRYHFGDTDPWGFDVLRSLRESLTPVPIAPLHMRFRPKPDAPLLSSRDQRKLAQLLHDPLLADLHPELALMQTTGTKGDFEQERLELSAHFPYHPSPTQGASSPATDH